MKQKYLEPEEQFLANMFQIELERARYLLRSYLRTRLEKISKFTTLCITDEILKSRLSIEELKFATQLEAITTKHLNESFLQFLPEKFRATDKEKISKFDPIYNGSSSATKLGIACSLQGKGNNRQS